ncbi:hypothetical protein [Nocardia bovistercoris]|uniref:Uncharacterized protein n=1 Tax=Nocardia bovistercoris TaxID=2785916 RepID=A0A931N5V3_9NOCA|nr:hypothetical protein [Nocardia bovistercoris]MBH0780259.1 hypothetical protein [Nocardia bovistercoris]
MTEVVATSETPTRDATARTGAISGEDTRLIRAEDIRRTPPEDTRRTSTEDMRRTSPTAKRWRFPSAVTSPGDDGIAAAVTWLTATTQRSGGTPMLRVPHASAISACAVLRNFVDRNRVVVTCPGDPAPAWRRGAVLAVDPERDDIAELADDPRTDALCVTPTRPADVVAWAAIADPALLGDATTPAPPSAPDPIPTQAMITLSGMLSRPLTLASASDHRDATAILDILYRAGHRCTGAAAYSWALANDWPAVGARRLAELADAFDNGRIPALPGGNPFRLAVLELWRTRAFAVGGPERIGAPD